MNDDILRAERMHLAGSFCGVFPKDTGSKPIADGFREQIFGHHAGWHRAKRDRDMKLPRNLDTLRHDANACHPSAQAIQAGYLVARFDGYRLHFFRAAASPESPIRNIRSYL